MSANTPALDPEAFVQCPYEENHKVRNQRLQIHLAQCRKVSQQVSLFRCLDVIHFCAMCNSVVYL